MKNGQRGRDTEISYTFKKITCQEINEANLQTKNIKAQRED